MTVKKPPTVGPKASDATLELFVREFRGRFCIVQPSSGSLKRGPYGQSRAAAKRLYRRYGLTAWLPASEQKSWRTDK